MWINFLLSFASAGLASAIWHYSHAWGYSVGALAGWQLYCTWSTRRGDSAASPVVLRLGGYSWDIFSFCRGWLITGQVGSGKTAAAINTMLWQVSKNCPTWGGVCVDDKGVYHETLTAMLKNLGRSNDLILLQVRPENAPVNWQPAHRFNFLDNPHLPDSAKAKIICDVAGSLGQRTEQSFFKIQAQVQMEFAFRAMRAAKIPVTLESTHELFSTNNLIDGVMDRITELGAPDREELLDHYVGNFKSQPAEQLGGVRSTILNYLKFFTDPDIAAVFCPEKSSFDFDQIDRGKIICVAIPQRFTVERRYINTLLKLTYYGHALRRYDKSAAERAKDNLLILWADEAQKIVTASDDGMSDFDVVDVIREARATVVAATQSYTSLIPPMNDERKAKIFIANMSNRVTFCAADEESAKIAADTLGRRKSVRRTRGWSAGKRSSTQIEEDRYYIEPHEFRRLRKFRAVVQHCDKGFRRTTLPPLDTNGRIPSWYAKGK